MLYIVPSRGRPENIRELIESFSDTRRIARLWICVDHDDPQLDRYADLKLPSWAAMWTGPRMRLGPTMNHYTREYLEGLRDGENEIIGFMGDDHRPRTLEWDVLIQGEAERLGNTAVIYGNDLFQGRNLPTAVAITSNILTRLGYFCPPGMTHLYQDNAWKGIGEAAGALSYMADVIIEHVHPHALNAAGQPKAVMDDGYAEVNSPEMYSADGIAYQAWLRDADGLDGWRTKLHRLKGVSR